MNEDMTKYLKQVMQKMCSYVDADYNKINFKEPQWFMKYEWNEGQTNEFKEWMIDLLTNNKEARIEIMNNPIKDKKRIEATVDFFIFNFGWKNKIEDNK